jgi:hypothetical protein
MEPAEGGESARKGGKKTRKKVVDAADVTGYI